MKELFVTYKYWKFKGTYKSYLGWNKFINKAKKLQYEEVRSVGTTYGMYVSTFRNDLYFDLEERPIDWLDPFCN